MHVSEAGQDRLSQIWSDGEMTPSEFNAYEQWTNSMAAALIDAMVADFGIKLEFFDPPVGYADEEVQTSAGEGPSNKDEHESECSKL